MNKPFEVCLLSVLLSPVVALAKTGILKDTGLIGGSPSLKLRRIKEKVGGKLGLKNIV